MKKMKMKLVATFILAATVMGLAACAPANPPVTEISVEAKEFAFQPATIEVTQGTTVRVLLRNTGTVEHDWSIQKIDVTIFKMESSSEHAGHSTASVPTLHAVAKIGQTTRLEFRPEQAGKYEILCLAAGHKEAGMVGQLIVNVKPN